MNTQPRTTGVILEAGKYKKVMDLPSSAVTGTFNIRIVSHDLAADVKVRLAICDETFLNDSLVPPDNAKWIQPVDTILGPTGFKYGMIEDTAVVLKQGEIIVAYSNTGKATCRVHGHVRLAV
jgi:hypothetical protein